MFKDEGFRGSKKAQKSYFFTIRSLLTQVRRIIGLFNQKDPPGSLRKITMLLNKYANSEIFSEFANRAASKMIKKASTSNAAAWEQTGYEISDHLKSLMSDDLETIDAFTQVKKLQIDLLKSLPTDLAKKVSDMSFEAVQTGQTSQAIVKEILQQTDFTYTRALTIARTEVSRVSSLYTQIRAQNIGSPGYFWATSEDSDVRSSHAALLDKFIYYNNPPTTDRLTYKAGQGPNCRCWMIPFLPMMPYKEQGLNATQMRNLPKEFKTSYLQLKQ